MGTVRPYYYLLIQSPQNLGAHWQFSTCRSRGEILRCTRQSPKGSI